MFIVKYILSSVVGGIILLHTVIAHEHSQKTNQIAEISAHECSIIIFDGVKHTFGIDHGDGHLEQFIKIKLDTPSPLLLSTLCFQVRSSSLGTIEVNQKTVLVALNIANLRRGPPTLSS